jgi:hypothetical protein
MIRTRLVVACIVALAGLGCPARAPTPPPRDDPPPPRKREDDGVAKGPATLDPRAYDGWTVEPADGGVVKIRHKYTEVARMEYVAFGPNWKWAIPIVEDKPKRGRAYPFTLTSKKLPVSIEGRVEPRGKDEIAIVYALRVAEDLKAIDGIGVQFILRANSSVWPQPPMAELGDAGWTVPVGDGDALDVALKGPGFHAEFEKKDATRIRMFFVQGDVARGSYEFEMKIRLPKGGKVLPSVAERYAPEDLDRWHAGTLEWNDWPVDLSFLNHKPAGKHGRVRAKNGDLVFEDGTPARFWGTNVVAQSLFEGTHQDIARQAKRIAAMGYNLVRIHHHDVAWIRRNVFDPSGGTTQKLDDAALERLDWWIECLRSEGVYVWIDLHVGRRFLPGDAIPAFEELQRTLEGEVHAFNYVNGRIEKLMHRFAEQYLGRRNRYTGNTWATEPSVVAVLVTNENDLTDHFGVQFLPDKNLPLHRAMFEDQADKIIADLGLPAREAKELWKPGPGKMLLAELQHRFDTRAIRQLRKLGVSVPIVTTSYWGNLKLFGLAALAGSDMIDAHSYGDAEALSTNPHYESNWIHFLATAQLVGRPMSVTEWSVPAPARDRFTAPLYAASMGALQGWDAMMQYCYNMAPNAEPAGTNRWVTWMDPSLIALAPTAALVYRRRDVKPANKTYVIRPGREEVWNAARNAETSATIRTLAEQSRIMIELPDTKELPWSSTGAGPARATVVTGLDRDFLPANATAVASDTGQVRRDFLAGVQTIDTPRTQAAAGWIGGREIALGDVLLEIDTPKAAVALTSLDGKPLSQSAKILVTAVARAVPDGAGYRSEPVRGRIWIRSELRARQGAGPLGLTPLSSRSRAGDAPRGRKTDPGARDGEAQIFTLPTDVATHWFLLHAK